MRTAMVPVFVVALGCAVEDAPGDPIAELERGGPSDPACEDHDEQLACLEAGCRWQLLFGVSFMDAGGCEIGPAWGLCYPPSFSQPCDDEALLCDDGMHAWVLPGPDDAVVMTRSATSCGLPDYFMPCDAPAFEDRLVARTNGSVAEHSTADDADDLLARACACGCAGPP